MFFCKIIIAQNALNYNSKNTDSISKIDFVAKKYKYLDRNFHVKMNANLYKETFEKYKFIERKSYTKNDSITVGLCAEFGSNDYSRIAKIHITYTWIRIGYHLLLSEIETKNIGNKLGFTHPYLFHSFIKNDVEDASVKSIIYDLKIRIKTIQKDADIEKMSNKELLNFGLKINPIRIEDYNTLVKNR